jgi:hypothetical protein
MDVEIRQKLEDLHFNRMTIDEYESQIQSGHLVRKPYLVDEREFERANPNHPLAASQFRRIDATDYFHELSLEAPEKFDLNLLQEMHLACADCCSTVRLVMVRTVGCLRNPISISVLERVIEKEESDTWTREVATQAIAVIKEDFSSVLGREHNWFEEWMMRATNAPLESRGTVKKHLEEKDRQHRSLANHVLSGQMILLENDESKGLVAVDQKSNESVPLTDGEVSGLLNVGRGLGWELQMVGIQIEPVIEVIQMENANFLDEFPNSVMLDTTTLRSAESCLRGMVTPVNLLDLSVVCTAAICYDRIVVQPVCSDIIAQYPTLFSCIKYSREAIAGTLWTMCCNLLNSHHPISPDSRTLEEAWKKMFRRDDIKLNIQNTNRYQDSPDYWDGIPASHFAKSLFSGSTIDRDSMNAFLSVQTMRTLFNDVLAGFLSMPYLSTSIRAPVLGVVMQRKAQLKPVVDALIDALGPADATPWEKNLPFTSELYAPFFLGLVLEKSSRPEDILPNILEYRKKAEPLRRQLRTDREAWSGRGRTYLKTIIGSINGFTDKEKDLASNAIKTTIATLTPLVTASQPQTQMASLGIKLAMLLRPLDKLKRLYSRMFRPHIYWLSELSEEAKALRNVEAQLVRVFGHSWTKDSRTCLELLAGTYPASFAKLRELRD